MLTNHDPVTGIAYGIISQHEVAGESLDGFEPDYGKPCNEEQICPACGATVAVGEDSDYGDLVECADCGLGFELELPDFAEPIAHVYEGDGYAVQIDDYGDVWVFKSPYTTMAEKCSPCAPGAGSLPVNGKEPKGSWAGAPEKTYCLGHDWFEDGVAPYPVYDAATGELIPPATKG